MPYRAQAVCASEGDLAMCDLSNPIYHDADKARVHLESIRWPDGPICPHCGVLDNAAELRGKAHRPGLYKCRDCRKQFTITVGTVFERSKVPLNKWLLATHLLTSSKKGISSHQIHRSLGVTYKTAWFMTHRIRCAMEPEPTILMGSGGGIVEADEMQPLSKCPIISAPRANGFAPACRKGGIRVRISVGAPFA